MQQDKQKEVAFFDNLASSQEYNVFTDEANNKIIHTLETLLALEPGARLLDLGCGSGIFTQLLEARGYQCIGLDLSHKLLGLGKKGTPSLPYVQADVEALPFASGSIDYVILSCLVHHLPNPERCAQEVFRVLKPNGRFVAFDPNRLNPFMYLYRDRTSPFYSSQGVTENERPVLPRHVQRVFQHAGLQASSHFVDGLAFRYVASGAARVLLPVYNFFDRTFFRASWLRLFRAFVFTYGIKPIA